MRGLSQILNIKGLQYTADPEYDLHLSPDVERAKNRVKELKEEGWLATYREVLITSGTESAYQVFRYKQEAKDLIKE